MTLVEAAKAWFINNRIDIADGLFEELQRLADDGKAGFIVTNTSQYLGDDEVIYDYNDDRTPSPLVFTHVQDAYWRSMVLNSEEKLVTRPWQTSFWVNRLEMKPEFHGEFDVVKLIGAANGNPAIPNG